MNGLKQLKKEEFFAIYRGLPNDLRTSLFAEETAEQMMAIKEKYSLSDESFSNLVRIVGRIMLGLLELKSFIKFLIDIAQIDNKKASTIAQDINKAIFQPVRESLMEVHGLKDEEVRSKKQEITNKVAPLKEYHQGVSLEELREMNPNTSDKRQVTSNKDFIAPEKSHQARSSVDNTTASSVFPSADKITKPTPSALPENVKRGSEVNKPKTKNNKPKTPRNTVSRNSRSSLSLKAHPSESKTGQATTVAWNGRTIDLRKIPPRRKSPK